MTILAKVTFTKGLIKIPLGQVVKNVEIGRVEVKIKSQFYKNSKFFCKNGIKSITNEKIEMMGIAITDVPLGLNRTKIFPQEFFIKPPESV